MSERFVPGYGTQVLGCCIFDGLINCIDEKRCNIRACPSVKQYRKHFAGNSKQLTSHVMLTQILSKALK